MNTATMTRVLYVKRTAADPRGKSCALYADTDGLIHDLPHSTAVYDQAGEFVGEVVAGAGLFKATIDGDTGWVGAWDGNFSNAVRKVGQLADGTLDRGHRAY